MRALISAACTRETVAAMEQRYGWTCVHVASVVAEAGALSPQDRADIVALVVEAEPVRAELIASLPSLAVIACLRSDPVNIDIEAASSAGVPVVYSPGRNAESVADFTLALLLAMTRGVARSHHDVVAGVLTVGDSARTHTRSDVIWASPDLNGNPYELYKGPELASLTVAVVGYGHVGAVVAGRLAPLVAQLLVVDPKADPSRVAGAGCELVEMGEALDEADVVSLHARSGQVIFGPAEFARLKTGGYLINTARATLLDHDALGAALRSGHLRGAALDVFPEEPLRTSSPLLSLPNLTLTPHLAGASNQVIERQSANLVATLEGLFDDSRSIAELPIANPGAVRRPLPMSSTDSASNSDGGAVR